MAFGGGITNTIGMTVIICTLFANATTNDGKL